eukprot:scaffold162857_cov33-Tisochrysis_lutea.AAC.2
MTCERIFALAASPLCPLPFSAALVGVGRRRLSSCRRVVSHVVRQLRCVLNPTEREPVGAHRPDTKSSNHSHGIKRRRGGTTRSGFKKE